MKENKRNNYLDILICISCFAIIMIHTTERLIYNNYLIINILYSISRFSIPIIIMVLGSILLDNKYKYNINNINKLFILFILWSLVYSIYNNLYLPYTLYGNIDYKTFILEIFTGPSHFFLFFVILCIYSFLPILRKLINKENKEEVELLILLLVVIIFLLPGIVKVLEYYFLDIGFLKLLKNSALSILLGSYILYFILGWYLNNYEVKKIYVYILGIIGIIYSSYILPIDFKIVRYEYDYTSISVLFLSMMVYILIKSIFSKKEINNKIIKSISKYSIGIYIIHVIIIDILYLYITSNIVVIYIITFGLSYLISFIISNIKVNQKLYNAYTNNGEG